MISFLRWFGLTTALTAVFTGCSLYLEQWLEPPVVARAEVSGPVILQPGFQVLVTGEVKAPGKYQLSQGALVADLVQQAGGLKPTAQIHPRELLRQLRPGEVLHVPAVSAQPQGLMPAGVELAAAVNTAAPQGAQTIQKIDLNTASAAQLEAIPGIGPVTAERIIAHRQQYGIFQSPQDLLKVKGIGAKTLARIQGYLQ
ncbi:MAG: ComEA family DNA-binding protein [Candidatus Sericytochromatia bacterium]|nr:ComEA family DNA-binding protein [Candidatus Sericytochromatia bacterium]